MFRSIKVSVTLGAAVLIASPGCCLPNLLCSHSSPSEETVVSGYSDEYIGDYSVVSSDCGCGCGVAAGETVSTGEFQVPTEAVANDAYLVNMPASETGAAGGSALLRVPQPRLLRVIPHSLLTKSTRCWTL